MKLLKILKPLAPAILSLLPFASTAQAQEASEPIISSQQFSLEQPYPTDEDCIHRVLSEFPGKNVEIIDSDGQISRVSYNGKEQTILSVIFEKDAYGRLMVEETRAFNNVTHGAPTRFGSQSFILYGLFNIEGQIQSGQKEDKVSDNSNIVDHTGTARKIDGGLRECRLNYIS